MLASIKITRPPLNNAIKSNILYCTNIEISTLRKLRTERNSHDRKDSGRAKAREAKGGVEEKGALWAESGRLSVGRVVQRRRPFTPDGSINHPESLPQRTTHAAPTPNENIPPPTGRPPAAYPSFGRRGPPGADVWGKNCQFDDGVWAKLNRSRLGSRG